jgi:hypothetical protein
MSKKIVLEGHMIWIFPFLLVLLTLFIIHYLREPFEFFDSEELDKKDSEELRKLDQKDSEELKELYQKDSEELKELYQKKEIKKVKENYETFNNTAELLKKDWRHEQLPKTLEPYYGQIQGYNCGQYSEFAFDSIKSPCLQEFCENTEIENPQNPSNYIFPEKIISKQEIPLSPFFLNHEKDVVNKRLEQEGDSGIERTKISAMEADFLSRPNYMYHNGDGTFNTFKINQ